MHLDKTINLVAVAAAIAVVASPFSPSNSFTRTLGKRVDPSTLTVDLGYAVYQGVSNSTLGINSWKGQVVTSIKRATIFST
jgi:hypothetical protein